MEVVRATIPVKPLKGVTVIAELPVEPELKSAGEVTVIVKSCTVMVTVALRASPLLDPVTVTV